jgi:hypothetical protein
VAQARRSPRPASTAAGRCKSPRQDLAGIDQRLLPLRELQRRTDENCELQARRHADNTAALRELAKKLDQHAASIATIRPTVAALELSRSKLATFASIGFAGFVLLGWVAEAAVRWTVSWTLSHFQ